MSSRRQDVPIPLWWRYSNRFPAEAFVSVVTVGEIVKGIEVLPDGRKKQELRVWLDSLEQHYSGQILPVDEETARIWGEVSASAQTQGRILLAVDGLIAATALQHGLVVMTRNIDDFAASGVRRLNPWST